MNERTNRILEEEDREDRNRGLAWMNERIRSYHRDGTVWKMR